MEQFKNEEGGGRSEDGTFSFGYSKLVGKRMSMEDFHDARIDTVAGRTIGLFGVYDGHGGKRAAEYVQKNLFDNLLNHPEFSTNTVEAISETFQQTDANYLKEDSGQNRDAGSTASTAVLMGRRLLVANVGDSRTVVCRAGQATALSKDHKPNHPEERARIEQAGGSVMWAGTWRVGGVLAVSRAFGDKLLKRYVVAEPEIQEYTVTSKDQFLVLASDGLWDVLKDQEAVSLVEAELDATKAAKALTQEAFRRGSADNITCVIVRFHLPEEEEVGEGNAGDGAAVDEGGEGAADGKVEGESNGAAAGDQTGDVVDAVEEGEKGSE